MIPKSSNFPDSLDDDTNLFVVHDSLRLKLIEDYNPGDTTIFVEGFADVINRFPPTGLITLTEQCSDVDERAISFYYGSRTNSSFDDLEILPEFKDVTKPKKITNVTMNVMDKHHNHIKDALIATQKFLGTKNIIDKTPFGETITGRVAFLKRLIFKPRAWFSIDKTIGLAPLKVKFKNQSFRVGDEEVTYTWSTWKEKNNNEPEEPEIITTNLKDDVEFTYSEPGNYNVSLHIKNNYGEDTLIIYNLINVRNECPDEASIEFIQRSNQIITEGVPSGDWSVGGPYSIPPKIRSCSDTFIEIEIPNLGGNPIENPNTPNRSYGGELMIGDSPIDRIVEYTWNLGDDLSHSNNPFTRASYKIGGIYDLNLRVDTEYGSYRITNYENCIDIIEQENLWLFNFKNQFQNDGGEVQAYEFGLFSETFKLLGNQTINVDRDNSFLDYLSDDPYFNETETRAKNEFSKNVNFAQQGTSSSGNRGDSLIFWASGGENLSDQKIKIKKYNAFADTYQNVPSITRPWNWASLVSNEKIYFLFGQGINNNLNSNNCFDQKTELNLTNLSVSSSNLNEFQFNGGAEELLSHPSSFDSSGIATNGYFATYRTTWKDSTGYVLRNSAVNEFFRLSDFYKTNGTLSNEFSSLTKLPDVAGSSKLEGELVSMSNGVFLFNNTGEISAWNDTSMTWEVGRSNSSTITFRSLQDTNAKDFNNKSNTLFAASDKDRIAYLSYDYSEKAFIKFNGTDLTFTSAGVRPSGKQFNMSIY